MPNVYKLETRTGYKDEEDSPLWDGTKNGMPLVSGVVYPVALDLILAIIADDDQYQEAKDGKINCNITGAKLKQGG